MAFRITGVAPVPECEDTGETPVIRWNIKYLKVH